jgi:ribulose-5-phosphate 4-epimerase/fuculose-1-phosphate aldolase
VLDNSEGDQLADIMLEKRVLMHQSHGVIICAETIAACFDLLYYLERVGNPIHPHVR